MGKLEQVYLEAMAEMDEVPLFKIDVANLTNHVLACVAWRLYRGSSANTYT